MTLVLLGIFLRAGIQFSDSQAQVPKVTADAVIGEDGNVNEDSLRAFVNWTGSVYQRLLNIQERTEFLGQVYQEGSDYNSGKIYPIVFAVDDVNGNDGSILIYGKDPNLNGTPALDVKDHDGNDVVKEMLKAKNPSGWSIAGMIRMMIRTTRRGPPASPVMPRVIPDPRITGTLLLLVDTIRI